MHAAMTIVYTDPSRVDEAIALFRDSTAPAIRDHPGGLEALLLVDRATGKGVAIGLYESEKSMLAFETSGKREEVLGGFADLMTAPAEPRQVYEVAVRGRLLREML